MKEVLGSLNALLNVSQLLITLMIYRWCIKERSRADRLEESNRKLTNRFIRFVMRIPLEYRIDVEDIEGDSFDSKYPPRDTED